MEKLLVYTQLASQDGFSTHVSCMLKFFLHPPKGGLPAFSDTKLGGEAAPSWELRTGKPTATLPNTCV